MTERRLKIKGVLLCYVVLCGVKCYGVVVLFVGYTQHNSLFRKKTGLRASFNKALYQEIQNRLLHPARYIL